MSSAAMLGRVVRTTILVGGALVARAWATAAPPADVLAEARAAIDAGRFRHAEALLRPLVADPAGPVTEEPAILLEIMRRIRLDYALTPEQMLEKLRRSIPDATAEDVERWRAEGVLQHRVLDGVVWYFVREPSNLFRFSAEAQARRKASGGASTGGFALPAHVAELLAEAQTAPGPMIRPTRHRVRYELRVKPGHPRVKPGAVVRCWLPFPQEYRQQRDVRLVACAPAEARIAPNGTPQRTIYFEQTIGGAAEPPRFMVEFEYVVAAYVPRLDPVLARGAEPAGALYREFTAERPPHIVFTPEVRATAAAIVGDETNPLRKARRIFRWVSENIRYCAEEEYSTIPSLALKALHTRKGDCGVQGLLFITLCRAAGVPARWQSGWVTLPGDWNMHDWAEFYVEPWGWLPADPSYGVQSHADPAVQEFYCGHMDAYRLIVNLDYGRVLDPPKTSFRSEPADFQRGEIEIDGHNLYYDEWDWTFDCRTEVLSPEAALTDAFGHRVRGWLAAGRVPGAVFEVGWRTAAGFRVWRQAFGWLRTVPDAVPMPVDAVFDLASVSKPVATGTSLMILAEQGKLSLDDPVGKYLPEFNAGEKRKVTIRHLMTHTAGLPPYVDAAEQRRLRVEAGFPCAAATRAYVRGLRIRGEPGHTVVYSCLSAILCAEIVERVAGCPLDAFAGEHIFGPLKMSDTSYHPPASQAARLVPTTAAPHGTGPGGFLYGQVHDPLAAMQGGVSGNAGLFSTAADLGRFAQMMLGGGERDGVRILKPETVAAMTGVQNEGAVSKEGRPDRRGLLWDLYVPEADARGLSALRAYGHAGYTGTAIRIYPDVGVYVIALTNRVHPDDSGKVEELRRATWRTVGEVLLGMPEP